MIRLSALTVREEEGGEGGGKWDAARSGGRSGRRLGFSFSRLPANSSIESGNES